MIDPTQQSAPWIGQEEYDALCAPFENIQKLDKGGVVLDYIAGEDVITRLNTVLGVAGWSFRVIQQGYNEEADEYWVLGELTVSRLDASGNIVPVLTRMQYGSQQTKRCRSDNKPLDIGFDLKGAATDALKKCASLIGVGLYLSHKEAGSPAPQQTVARVERPAPPRPAGTVPAHAVAQLPQGHPAAGAAVERALAADAAEQRGGQVEQRPPDEDAIPFDGGEFDSPRNAPRCACGLPREYKTGTSAKNGKPWAAWMCTNPDKAKRCDPQWER